MHIIISIRDGDDYIQASKMGDGHTTIGGSGDTEGKYGDILVEAVERLKEELDG